MNTIMFKIQFMFVAVTMMIFTSIVGCAQTPSSSASSKNAGYTAENPGWLVNLDEAYNLSKKTGKPIMANFTGSDWCGWCKRLTASVFSQDEFKNWAEKNVILLEIDFPRRKTLPENYRNQNNNLQQAFQVNGYPTVWLFDLEKNKTNGNYDIKALGKTGYRPTAAEFINESNSFIAARKK